MKRVFDVVISSVILLLTSPVLIGAMLLVWLQDYCSPFYVANRVGENGREFKMIKIRSMVKGADKSGVDSTSASDMRITKVGHFIRKCKIDELSQLLNVLRGDMSLVGPRPNVKRETDLYTEEERELLKLKPGITDIASIVFADEGEILRDSKDPDLDYNQRIRPWKSRLGLLYIRNQTLWLDCKLIFMTALTIVDRQRALSAVAVLVEALGADRQLTQIASRSVALIPFAPPGSREIVTSRKVDSTRVAV